MQTSWTRNASTVSVAGTVLAMLGLLLTAAAPVAGGSSATCDYTASTHKVRVTITGPGTTNVYENGSGRIHVNGVWCENTATVTNTDRITILAGAGAQFVSLFWNGSGFQPGATNEAGDSDEIEIAVSLGGDTDKLFVAGGLSADNIVAGKSSGFAVVGRVNLNAGETNGIDADLTLVLGIERLRINGAGGSDIISGAGGAATGDIFMLPLEIYGTFGDDTLTGGAASDDIDGGVGDDTLMGGAAHDTIIGGPDDDTLKVGAGPDYLNAVDSVSGNDQVYGGTGVDTCVTDPGDSKTSC